MRTVNQPTAAPTNKVTASTVGAALAVLLVYVGRQVGVELPDEVAAAIVLVGTFLAGYFTKERA